MIDVQATLVLMAGPVPWSPEQTKLLCRMWWDGASRSDLLATFSGRTWTAIRSRAHLYGAIRPAWFRSIANRRVA